MRALIAAIAVVVALASTACWWPVRDGGYRDERSSYGERSSGHGRGPERGDDHEGRHDMGDDHR